MSTVAPPMRRLLRPRFWNKVMSGVFVALNKWLPVPSGNRVMVSKLNPLKSAGIA
jgi:hypothetical protein